MLHDPTQAYSSVFPGAAQTWVLLFNCHTSCVFHRRSTALI